MYGLKTCIFFKIPLIRNLPYNLQLIIYYFLFYIFYICGKHFLSMGYLFIDDLSRAVLQFNPSVLGGGTGGFNQPVGPSGDFFPVISNDLEPGTSTSRDCNTRINDLKNDPLLCTTYKNALIKQEKIISVMTEILTESGVPFDNPKDIRNAVDVYLTKTMELDEDKRARKLRAILNSLTKDRSNSTYYCLMVKEISS